MAGSSDEDENYWPGYVDALTTMTMVLTFVMMVLGVMVFILSQDLSQSKIGMIARALKITSEEAEKLNEQELQRAMRAMAEQSATQSSSDNPDGSQGASAKAGGPSNQEGGGKGSGGGMGINVEAKTMDTNPFQSPFEGGLIGDKAAGPGGEYLVTDAGRVAGNATGTGSRVQQGSGGLRFVFERSAIDLPPLGTEAIEAYVAAQGRGPVVVRATAVAVDGGPTEARRRAYFRAMLVRTRLLKAGISPRDIEVQVRDQTQAAAQEIVDVLRATGG